MTDGASGEAAAGPGRSSSSDKFVVLAATLASSGLTMLGGFVSALALDAGMKGTVALTAAVATLCATVVAWGLPATYSRTMSAAWQGSAAVRAWSGPVTMVQAAMAAGVSVIVVSTVPLAFADAAEPHLRAGAALLGSAAVLNTASGSIRRAVGKHKSAAAMATTRAATVLALYIWIVVSARPIDDVVMLLGAVLLCNGFAIALMTLIPESRAVDSMAIGGGDVRRTAGYSTPAALGNIVQFLNYRLDVILLGLVSDASSVGQYSVAATITAVAWVLPNALGGLIQRDATFETSDRVSRFGLLSRRSVAAAVCFAVAGAPAAFVLSRYVLDDSYERLPLFYLLLAPGTVAVVVWKNFVNFSIGAGSSRTALQSSWAGIVAALGIGLPLTVIIGAPGLAIASTLGYAGAAWLAVRHVRATVPESVGQRLVWPQVSDLRIQEIVCAAVQVRSN